LQGWICAIFGGEARQVEHASLDPVDPANLARDLGQPPAFGHFAGAGVFGARRAVDDQDARRLVWVFKFALRLVDRGLGSAPVVGKLIAGVGIAFARGAAVGRFAAIDIIAEGDRRDAVERLARLGKARIGELVEEALAKLGLVEVDVGHAGARFGGLFVLRSTFCHALFPCSNPMGP